MSTAPHCDAPWAAGQLVLRQLGGDEPTAPQWDLPLSLHQVTIGAGRTCSVRLAEPGVRPLHCVISLGEDGPVARRWSAGTLLNGEAFVEASLAVGDRLTIGPVELELLTTPPEGPFEDVGPDRDAPGHSAQALGEVPFEKDADEVPLSSCERPTGDTLDQPATSGPPADRITLGQLTATRRHGAERARQLIAALRTARHERNAEIDKCFDLQHQIERKARLRAELEAELTEAQSLLTGAREELQHQHDAHQAEVAALQEQMEQLQDSLVARDAQIARLQAELEAQASGYPGTDDERAGEERFGEAPPAPIAAADDEEPASESIWGGFPAGRETPEQDTPHAPGLELSAPVAEETPQLWGAPPQPPSPSSTSHPASLPEDPQEASVSGSLWGEAAVEPAAEVAAQPDWEEAPAPPTTDRGDLWDIERQVANSRWGVEEPSPPDFPSTETSQSPDPFAEVVGEVAGPFPPAVEEFQEEEEEEEEESLWGEPSGAVNPSPVEDPDQFSRSEPMEGVSGWETTATPQDTPAGESLWNTDRPQGATAVAAGAEEPSNEPFTPPSYIEQFAHLLEADSEDAHSVAAQPVVPPKPVAPPAPAADPLADEESIEEYMAKMMSRLRGQPGTAAAASVSIEPESREGAPAVEAPDGASCEAAPKELPLTSLDQLKRVAAPERQANMSLLRDLANSSARLAIGTADVRRARQTAWANLGCSMLAAVSGGYLIWAAPQPLSPQTAGGVVAAIAAAMWGNRSWRSIRQAKRDRRQSSPDKELPEPGEQLPIDVSL